MAEKDLFDEIQAILHGRSTAAIMQALLQCLLVNITVSAPSVARAEALLDAIPAELKPGLRANWLKYRSPESHAEKQGQH